MNTVSEKPLMIDRFKRDEILHKLLNSYERKKSKIVK